MNSQQSKNFYLFRHGECPFNVSGHIQGQRFDGRLTPRGCTQAEEVGRRLSGKKIEIIVSSPMRRAIETAKLANRYLHVPIFIDRRLTEVNLGIAEGLHISVAEKRFKNIYQKWRKPDISDTSTRCEQGETKAEVRRRVFAALNYYAVATPYHNIAVSGHGIMLSQILLTAGIGQSNIPNGAILRLTYDGDWKFAGFLN